jgi:tetratricopeptide (TPR) repeat protein
VSEATRRATDRAITYGPERPGPPGGRDPLPAWPALAPRAGTVASRRLFPPLVARDRELAELMAAATRARAAGPELVTVIGAAGIGKSRLVAELADRLAAQPDPAAAPDPGPPTPPPRFAWRQGRALPYGDGPTFGALAEVVKAEAGILESDGAELAGRRLAAAAAEVAEPVTAAWIAGHLRRLVGVGAGRAGGAGPTTAADREEEFAAWRRFLHGLAGNRPLALVLEDLHRADDALLDFVEGLVDRDSGRVPVLVLATARPELLERRPGWGAGGTTIPLEPLSDGDTTGLLATLLAHHGLPTAVDPALLGRVGGNPLFAEEYARLLRDRGDPVADGPAPVPPPPLPTGVHAILAARLDALPAADKAVLHDAAVLGQVGWLGALAEIAGRDREQLEASLDRLEAREFLRRAPASRVAGEVEYGFRHTLVRDVAYGQVLRAQRADKHRRAAAWIEGLAPDRAEGRAELLAYHYRAALSFARAAGTEPPGLAARTLAALREAGDRAEALGGWETAARFHAEALELSPEGDPARGQLLLRLGRARCRGEMAGHDELTAARDLLLAQGTPVAAAEAEMLLGELAFVQGRSREAHLARALELVAGAPPSAARAAVLGGAMMHLMMASRHAEGLAVGREVLGMARALGLRNLEADALGAIGTTRVEAGDPGGLDDLEAAIAMGGEAGGPDTARWYLNLAWAAAALGDLRRCFAALAAGERLAERFGSLRRRRAIELQRVAERYWTGRWAEAVAVVDAMVAGGERTYLAWECRLWRGRIRLAGGSLDAALEDARAAHDLAREAGDPQDLHPTRAFLARALLAAGRRGEAAEVAERLLGGLGGEVLGPDLGANLGLVLAELGIPAEALDRRGVPPSPWLEAARALAAGDPLAAADRYAAIGSRPDEADARLAAARLLASQGRPTEAGAQLAAARAFLASATG